MNSSSIAAKTTFETFAPNHEGSMGGGGTSQVNDISLSPSSSSPFSDMDVNNVNGNVTFDMDLFSPSTIPAMQSLASGSGFPTSHLANMSDSKLGSINNSDFTLVKNSFNFMPGVSSEQDFLNDTRTYKHIDRSESGSTSRKKLVPTLVPVDGGMSNPTGTTERAAPKKKWTKDEDRRLRALVEAHGENWTLVTELLNGNVGQRSMMHCSNRWSKVLKPGMRKGPWTKEEDAKLKMIVDRHGVAEKAKWSTIALELPGRIGKQCRER